MDQLKQVLKYQFWILLAVALILPVVGWFMSTSGLVTEAATRTGELKKKDDGLSVKPDDPNGDWANGLEQVNKEQEKQKAIAWKVVYDRQKELMTWPDFMPADLSHIEAWQQEKYRTSYRGELDKVRQIVKPFDENFQNGLVQYAEELLPAPDVPWKYQPPSPAQIQAAQEDLWLLAALLECVASVNEGANTPFEAPIRSIDLLNLRGGSTGGASSSGSSSSSSSTSSGGGAFTGGGAMKANIQMAEMMAAGKAAQARSGGMSGMSGMGAGGGGGSPAINSAQIDADDVLGAEQSGSSSVSTSTTTTTTTGKSLLSGVEEKGRYRQDKAEWRTRGFELQVTMDHRRIPDLLVSLSNCDWPVSIMRVQEADSQDEDLVPADSSDGRGSGAGMGMGMGMGMMGRGMGKGMGMAMPGMGAMAGNGPAMGGLGGAGAGVGRKDRPLARPQAVRPAKGADADEEFSSGPQRSPLDDPNLATVSVVGWLYIFKQPTAPAGAQPATPAASPGAPASTTPPADGIAAAAPSAAPAATTPAGAEAPAEAAAPSEGAAAAEGEAEKPAVAGDEEEMKDEQPSAEAPSEDVPEGDTGGKAEQGSK